MYDGCSSSYYFPLSVTTMSSVCPLTTSGPSLSSAPSPVSPPPRSDASPAPPTHSTLSLNTGWADFSLSHTNTHPHPLSTYSSHFTPCGSANVGNCLCVCVQMYLCVCGFVIHSSWYKKNGDVSNYINDFAAHLRWIQPAESVILHTRLYLWIVGTFQLFYTDKTILTNRRPHKVKQTHTHTHTQIRNSHTHTLSHKRICHYQV